MKTEPEAYKPWASLNQRIRHKETGETGVYVEHYNIGEGYLMLTDKGQKIIAGNYDDFEPVVHENE